MVIIKNILKNIFYFFFAFLSIILFVLFYLPFDCMRGYSKLGKELFDFLFKREIK